MTDAPSRLVEDGLCCQGGAMNARSLLLVAALPLLAFSLGAASPPPGPADAEALRDTALANDKVAWEIVEGLTTEIGPRLAGSPDEARARDWAVRKLKSLGFRNVHIEDAHMAGWVRGAESAEIVAPFPQRLVLTALGGSGATSATGLTADVVGFDDVAALEAAPPAAIRGKIVFVSHA